MHFPPVRRPSKYEEHFWIEYLSPNEPCMMTGEKSSLVFCQWNSFIGSIVCCSALNCEFLPMQDDTYLGMAFDWGLFSISEWPLWPIWAVPHISFTSSDCPWFDLFFLLLRIIIMLFKQSIIECSSLEMVAMAKLCKTSVENAWFDDNLEAESNIERSRQCSSARVASMQSS